MLCNGLLKISCDELVLPRRVTVDNVAWLVINTLPALPLDQLNPISLSNPDACKILKTPVLTNVTAPVWLLTVPLAEIPLPGTMLVTPVFVNVTVTPDAVVDTPTVMPVDPTMLELANTLRP